MKQHGGTFRWLVAMATLAVATRAQDYFPDPIPYSGIALAVTEVATVPDSSPGSPPRMSVITEDPAGRLFVNDQRGPLYLVEEHTGTVTEYLDLRDYGELAILATSEAGFQSFAFHPDFHQEGAPGYGRFYTFHSSNDTSSTPDFDPGGSTSFHSLLLEWRADDPAAATFLPADARQPYREILRFKQPYANHNGGLVAFHPLATDPAHEDYGLLYLALGDGGSGSDPQENGEDPSNPYGAILRIDPLGDDSANGAYGIVADNVLASDGDASTRGEIFCYGLRNPQRFGWDLATGAGYIADIGQSKAEEINVLANGANYGWDAREGSFFHEGPVGDSVGPVAEYDHISPVSDMPTAIPNRAVTLGEPVRGACIPELEGMLVISDFPTGLLFLLDVDNDPLEGGQGGLSEWKLQAEGGSPVHLLDVINAARAARGLSGTSRADTRFGVNTPGKVYIINKHDGILRRVTPTAGPTVNLLDAGAGSVDLELEGLLQQSTDMATWEMVVPQPIGQVPAPAPVAFYRSILR